MENFEIESYIQSYNEYFGIEDDLEPIIIPFSLSDEGINNYKDYLIQNSGITSYSENNIINVSLISLYGNTLCCYKVKDQIKILTDQNGYEQKQFYNVNCNDILNIENNDRTESVDRLLDWLINPKDNELIADSVISRMINTRLKRMKISTPYNKKWNLNLMLPPVSEDLIHLDIRNIINNVCSNNSIVLVSDYSALAGNFNSKQRVYLVMYLENGSNGKVIVSSYFKHNSKTVCEGNFCTCFTNSNREEIELFNFNETSFIINNKKNIVHENSNSQNTKLFDTKIMIDEEIPGYITFLNNHSETFFEIEYSYAKKCDNELFNDIPLGAIVSPLTIYLNNFKERDRNKIALSDMVYITDVMEKSKCFKTTYLKTNRKSKLGTSNKWKVNESILKFPINYCDIKWRFINSESGNDKEIMQSIFEGENKATEYISSELLYLENDDYNIDPSALNTLMVFDSLEQRLDMSPIIKKSIINENDYAIVVPKEEEPVKNVRINLLINKLKVSTGIKDYLGYKNIFNVNQLYDYSLLQLREQVQLSTLQVKQLNDALSSLGIHLKDDGFDKKYGRIKATNAYTKATHTTNKAIEDVGFSLRTFNCLKRRGISNLNQLSDMDYYELLKIRNLGKNGVKEIQSKLVSFGYTLKK